MPASTPIYSLPYPILGDSADIEQAVKPLALALDNKLASAGGAALYVTTVGDAVNRVINVNHQLGTPNVSPVLRLASTGEVVQAEAYVLDNDNLRLVFASPPGNAAVVVAIFGGVTPPPAPVGVYSANIGDGASSGPFLVNHLLGTRDFVLQAFLNVAPYDEVELDYERTDGNTVTVYTRGIVPATNGVRVMVLSRAGLQGAAAQHGVNHTPGGNDPIPLADRQNASLVQPGVIDPTDGVVTRLNATTLRVAAGKAWVPYATGGRAYAEWAQTDLTVAAAAAGQQRIDSVAITFGGAGGIGTPALVGGTPVAGSATFAANTPAIPAQSIRLADALITNAGVDPGAANVRDRRPWARGAYVETGLVTGPSYGATGAAADLGLTRRIECSGAPLIVEPFGYFQHNGTTGALLWGLLYALLDGGTPQVMGGTSTTVTGGYSVGMGKAVFHPAAGSHTINMTYLVGLASALGLYSYGYVAHEDLRSAAHNGTV